MKIFFGGCIVFLFLSNHCTAQLGQPIPVPVLKEDKKVDDLMDKIFKNEQDSGQVDKSLLSDSCWVINMYRLDKGDDFDVDLIRNSKSVINYRVCRYAYYKAKYGCFIYKGNKIFVWAKDEFGSLFTAASTYQKFNFIFFHWEDYHLL